MTLEIRAVDPSSHESELRLRLTRLPRLTRTGATWLYEHATELEHLSLRSAYVDGTLAACGSAARSPWFPPGFATVDVTVARPFERRGVGSALYRALLDTLPPTIDRIGLSVEDDDPDSLAIARAHGFEPTQLAVESRLSLVDLPDPVAIPGVTFEDVAGLELPDEDDVEAMLVDSQTNPEAGEGFITHLADLRSLAVGSPHPVGVLARVDGAPAAIMVGGIRDGVLSVIYTGVGRRFRGRNIGFALKQYAHRVAADAGATAALTTNEASNAGIRHVNRRLGYEIVRGTYRLHGTRPDRTR